MVFDVSDGYLLKRLLLLELLLLAAVCVQLTNGQQDTGVSLIINRVTIPSNSLVDVDDTLYTSRRDQAPTNDRTAQHDSALLCVTDLVDCCETQRLGNWYFPDGTVVPMNDGGGYQSNRGNNELLSGRQFNGSVRLYRFYSSLTRGRFRCVLPNADNVNQTLYANIVDFGTDFRVAPVPTPQSSGSTTAGETGVSLTCSTLLVTPVPLPSDIPTPTFQWFFGPNGNDLLPSGVTPPTTTSSMSSNPDGITYTSTLQFPQLSQRLHTGVYTCRIGAGRLASNAMVTVNDPMIVAIVNPSFDTPLMAGRTGTTLTCDVSGANNLSPTITYQWTKDGQATVRSDHQSLTLSPLRLSHAGVYTCNVSVSSSFLNNAISASAGNTQTVRIQIPNPQSVTVTSSHGSTVLNGTTVTVTCTVEFSPSVMSESDLSLITVEAQIFRDGNELTQTSSQTNGLSYTFGVMVSSFSESDNGNYSCSATVQPSSSPNLSGMGQGESDPIQIVVGIPSTTPPPLPPPGPSGSGSSNSSNTGCVNEIAISVAVTILVELLLAAPIIGAVLALCWKRNHRKNQSAKSDASAARQRYGVSEDVYEEPDKTATATGPTAVGKFELTDCPAYATTDTLHPRPGAETQQLQTSHYEL